MRCRIWIKTGMRNRPRLWFPKRTLEAARGYAGQKVAVHNFASATNPGGGVTTGAGAQEECICRCSTPVFLPENPGDAESFYTPHRQAQNPIHNDDIIYTPEVLVFKTDTAVPRRMDERGVVCGGCHHLRCTEPAGEAQQPLQLRGWKPRGFREKQGTDGYPRQTPAPDAGHSTGKRSGNGDLGRLWMRCLRKQSRSRGHGSKECAERLPPRLCNLEFAVYCTQRDENNYRVFERVLRGYCKA